MAIVSCLVWLKQGDWYVRTIPWFLNTGNISIIANNVAAMIEIASLVLIGLLKLLIWLTLLRLPSLFSLACPSEAVDKIGVTLG